MGLLSELRRRNVIRVAIAYAIAAWLLIEVTATTFPMLRLPEWTATFVTVLLMIGFPLALIITWAFELTPEGLKREKDISADDRSAVTPVVMEQSVAVLPFADMSPDKDQEYFSDGIAEELLNQLTKLSGLHVAGRTSSFYFKGKNEDFRVIGEKLNVAHILEGSVRKAGNRVRITAQLVKAVDGYHLWSETFDRDLDDIFAIQDETAKAVADVLSITLGVGDVDLGAGSTRNFPAYDAYLAGLAFRQKEGRENIESAIEYLERAVQLDPDFGNAWSQLAFANLLAAESAIPERADEFHPKADHAAKRAAEAAPDAVSSLIARGVLHVRQQKWLDAETMLERALEHSPTDAFGNNWYAMFLMNVGRTKKAEQFQRLAVRAEPLSVFQNRMLGLALENEGDLDQALEQYRLATTLPGDHELVHLSMFVLAMEMGNRALIEEILAQRLITENMLPAVRNLSVGMQPLLDSPEAAMAELHRMHLDPDFDNPWLLNAIAVWALYFGDPELALKIYTEILETNFTSYLVMWRPIYKEMRCLAGFKDVLRDLGLVEYWRSTGNWGDYCRPIGDDDFECE